MRTVRGRTDRIVVVGAGLGGLSAALHLAGAGRQVIVLEREDRPGGRAGRLTIDGYTFDTGPTVLTMPGLVAETLGAVGERLDDWVDLVELDPVYRMFFPDGTRLDVRSDRDGMAAEITRVVDKREADGYLRYVAYLERLFAVEYDDFIARNMDRPTDLLTANLARLVMMGGLRRLDTKARQFLRDPRTLRAMSFQAMYAGVPPQRALALYGVITYMDSVAGVTVPRGGMHEIPLALAGAAAKHGVDLRYGRTVTSVEHRDGRAHTVVTADGERIGADVVVINADLPVAYAELLGLTPRRHRRLRYSPSAFVMLVGSDRAYPGAAHHNIHFGRAWRRTFAEIVDRGELMSDPSFLVTHLSHTDPAPAPAGRYAYYLLFPTPNLTSVVDWTTERERYADAALDLMERRGYPGFRSSVRACHVTTPLDWRRLGMAAGTPFAAAHTFGQTGPFRPGNLWGENVVFAGSGTIPGVGVPMVLISGRLAAQRILGTDAVTARR